MKLRIGIFAAAIAALTSCIENTLPYPVVVIDVLRVEGEGFSVAGGDIDTENRVVTLRLEEPTDITKVTITNVAISEGGSCTESLTGTFDLSAPRYVTLSLYQNYMWEFRAEQQFTYAFAVEGQMEESVIDPIARTARATVNKNTDLKSIRITELKLGPRDVTTIDPAIDELTDFTSMRYVDVYYHDEHKRWRLYVEQSEEKLTLGQLDLWNNTATFTGMVSAEEYAQARIEYRVKGTEEWMTTVKGEYNDSGMFSASAEPAWTEGVNNAGIAIHTLRSTEGLFANRSYEYRLMIDNTEIQMNEFETAAGDVIPDAGFEDASLSCFTDKNTAAPFWGSGNNTFAPKLCSQSTFLGQEGAKCAKLTASAPVGILAAGNLFSGTFYKDGLTTGVVEFGQSYAWTARPSAMKVKYYAEKIGTVDINKHSGAPIGLGDQDRGRIFVAIVDWDTRHKVSSGTSAPTGIWDPEASAMTAEGKVIAYGSVFIDKNSEGGTMIEVEIPLNYYDRTTRPGKQFTIALSCSTSAYGDFMVGCKSNVMYVDDFRWVY